MAKSYIPGRGLDFDEDERGSHCYFAVRWLTGTIKEGDWSEIFHVIVP
jgi:hypothetical protein